MECLAARTDRVDVLAVEESVERTAWSIVGDEVGLSTNGVGEAKIVRIESTNLQQVR